MKRKALGALILGLGLAMLVWGSRSFVALPPPKAPPADPDDIVGSLSHDVIDSPTTGEMIKGLVTGPVGRKMSELLVACVGFVLASGATLSLLPRETRRRANQPTKGLSR